MAVCMVAFAFDADAQGKDRSRTRRDTREQLAEKQANHIADKLSLDGDKRRRLKEAFMQCQKEVWNLGKPPRPDAKPASEAEAERELKKRFERAQKLLDIRRRYYDVYAQFLTNMQIHELYDIEEAMMRNMRRRCPPTK